MLDVELELKYYKPAVTLKGTTLVVNCHLF